MKPFVKSLKSYSLYEAVKGINYRQISAHSSIEPVEVDYVPVEKASKIEGHMHAKSNALCCILEGSGMVALDGKRVKIRKNDVVNIPVGTWHEFFASDKEKLVFLSIQYPPIGEDYVFERNSL
jgi:mannose-6-phosphate isomerase-like protein (cupin superfamily)